MRRLVPAFLLAITVLTGCIGGADRVTGTPSYTGTGNATPQHDPALVGSWRSFTVLEGNGGEVIVTELVWEFVADGNATRVIFTTNLDSGSSVTDISPARWSTNRGVVDIVFLPPLGGQLRYQYDTDATRLRLGPFTLERDP